MSRKTTQIGLMVATAAILFSVESLIPVPFPWFRLGLANVITLLALRWWGLKEGLFIVLLRVIIGSLITGRLMQPMFVLSLGGSIAAALGMAAFLPLHQRGLSLIGISMIGAVLKNVTQLILTYILIISEIHLVFLAPAMFVASLITGFITGLCAIILDHRLVETVEIGSQSA